MPVGGVYIVAYVVVSLMTVLNQLVSTIHSSRYIIIHNSIFLL